MVKRCSFGLLLISLAVVGLASGCAILPSGARETSRVEYETPGGPDWDSGSLEASYQYSGDVLTVIATEDPKTPHPKRQWRAGIIPAGIIPHEEWPFLLFQSESLPEDFDDFCVSHKVKGRLLFCTAHRLAPGYPPTGYNFWVVEEVVVDAVSTPNQLVISYAGDARQSSCGLHSLPGKQVWYWSDYEKRPKIEQLLHYADRKSSLQFLIIADRDQKHYNKLLKHIRKICDTGVEEHPLPEVYLGPFHLEEKEPEPTAEAAAEAAAEPSERK